MARCRPERLKLAPTALGFTVALMAGCSGPPAAVPPAPAPAPPPQASRAPATGEAAPQQAVAGFTPLATPQQVVGAMAVGRPDPFASPQVLAGAGGGASATAGGATAGLPQGLRLTGVLRTGGRVQAFVQIGDRSGALCPGPRGQCQGGAADQPLLPAGWSVTAIDADHGLMALRFGNQRQVLRVSP